MKTLTKTALTTTALLATAMGTHANAAHLQESTLAGTYDHTADGDLVWQIDTANPFYLTGANALSDISVTGSVDVSGLSTGGSSSVVYVGLQQGTSFVLFQPRLQAGYQGNGVGAVGQGGSKPAKTCRTGSSRLKTPPRPRSTSCLMRRP